LVEGGLQLGDPLLGVGQLLGEAALGDLTVGQRRLHLTDALLGGNPSSPLRGELAPHVVQLGVPLPGVGRGPLGGGLGGYQLAAGAPLLPLLGVGFGRRLLLGLDLGQLLGPALRSAQPQHAGRADGVRFDGLGHAGPELVVAVDHAGDDGQRRSGQLGEAQVAPQGRRWQDRRVSRHSLSSDGESGLDRGTHDPGRVGQVASARSTASSSSIVSTAPPLPHQRQVTSSIVSSRTTSSSTWSSPPTEKW
jgi:hypothetical protein